MGLIVNTNLIIYYYKFLKWIYSNNSRESCKTNSDYYSDACFSMFSDEYSLYMLKYEDKLRIISEFEDGEEFINEQNSFYDTRNTPAKYNLKIKSHKNIFKTEIRHENENNCDFQIDYNETLIKKDCFIRDCDLIPMNFIKFNEKINWKDIIIEREYNENGFPPYCYFKLQNCDSNKTPQLQHFKNKYDFEWNSENNYYEIKIMFTKLEIYILYFQNNKNYIIKFEEFI